MYQAYNIQIQLRMCRFLDHPHKMNLQHFENFLINLINYRVLRIILVSVEVSWSHLLILMYVAICKHYQLCVYTISDMEVHNMKLFSIWVKISIFTVEDYGSSIEVFHIFYLISVFLIFLMQEFPLYCFSCKLPQPLTVNVKNFGKNIRNARFNVVIQSIN